MSRVRRLLVSDRIFFVTVNLRRRLPFLREEELPLVVEAPRRLALVKLQQLFVGEAASSVVPNPHRLCADAGVVRDERRAHGTRAVPWPAGASGVRLVARVERVRLV